MLSSETPAEAAAAKGFMMAKPRATKAAPGGGKEKKGNKEMCFTECHTPTSSAASARRPVDEFKGSQHVVVSAAHNPS